MSARKDCSSRTAALSSFSDKRVSEGCPSVLLRMLLASLLSPEMVFLTALMERFSGFDPLAVAEESVFLCFFVDVDFLGLPGVSSMLPATDSDFLWPFEVAGFTGLVSPSSSSLLVFSWARSPAMSFG